MPPPRPEGGLVWAHADGPERARALVALAARLQVQRPEVSVLLTYPPGCAAPSTCPSAGTSLLQPLPVDSLSEATAFARHWRPAVGLWTGQRLHPALLSRLAETGTRLMLLGAEDAAWDTPAPMWVPDCAPATLALFDRLFASSDAALRRLRRSGLGEDRLRRGGPLSETAPPLDYVPDQHEEMAEVLSGRPVWIAARARADETPDILSAHRRALRLAHRLLLILVPADAAEGRQITEIARKSDLRLACWEAGDIPDENTQVLLTEDSADLGLWYRLAPVAFLGGSLRPGHGGEDPFEAAAHGTALLYGPNVGRHLSAYTRMVDAGAARIVRDFDSLAVAVSQLVAPDRAAAMAHAGWDVVSQGAELTDDVITLTLDWIDSKPGEAA